MVNLQRRFDLTMSAQNLSESLKECALTAFMLLVVPIMDHRTGIVCQRL